MGAMLSALTVPGHQMKAFPKTGMRTYCRTPNPEFQKVCRVLLGNPVAPRMQDLSPTIDRPGGEDPIRCRHHPSSRPSLKMTHWPTTSRTVSAQRFPLTPQQVGAQDPGRQHLHGNTGRSLSEETQHSRMPSWVPDLPATGCGRLPSRASSQVPLLGVCSPLELAH